MSDTKRETLIETTFQLGIEFAEKLKPFLALASDINPDKDMYKLSTLYFFSKSYKTYQAVKLLWEKGFTEDAFMLTRTIFELAMQAVYMAEKPTERAKRFIEHEQCVFHKFYENLGKGGLGDWIKDRKNDVKPWKKQHEKYCRQYSDIRADNWWGRDIQKLINNNDDLKKRCTYFYSWASNYIHSTLFVAEDYITVAEQITPNCYPAVSGDHKIVVEATDSFATIVRITSNAFGIDIEKIVCLFKENFNKYVQEICCDVEA